MTFDKTVKPFVVWLSILLLAILNGGLREVVLIPALGNPQGLILSGVLLSALILVVTYFALPWLGWHSVAGYIVIGLAWLCFTLTFEFTFGYFIEAKTWSQLCDAYVFKDGNIWPVVLFTTAVAPYVTARFRGWS